jgi:LacI family transcriptional regulator, galactose operon repressor
MGVTIYDLAREAGVGIGTVSRCLNNHPSVAAHTRARVLAAAKRLAYQPHAYAQRLASRKTNTVSAIIPYFTNYFFIQVLQGIQDKAADLGFDLILYGVNNPSDVEYYLRRSLHRGRVDGVLFFSMKLPENYVQKFHQMGLPLVLVDAFHERFDSIRVENRRGAQDATRHLLSLGHRKIAMINGVLHTIPARERFDGYADALREAGLPLQEDIVISSQSHKQDGFSREAGRESMERLLPSLRGGDPVTAVFVASDVQSMGVLEYAREHRVRIPEDLALVSFDDIELAQHLQLTTMRQPMYEMGVLALERLVARIGNPGFPPALSTFVPQLIVRQTSGPSRVQAHPASASPGVVTVDRSP